MMTREAKVGLLLGLVFIVAIAVVLKGVGSPAPSEIQPLVPNQNLNAHGLGSGHQLQVNIQTDNRNRSFNQNTQRTGNDQNQSTQRPAQGSPSVQGYAPVKGASAPNQHVPRTIRNTNIPEVDINDLRKITNANVPTPIAPSDVNQGIIVNHRQGLPTSHANNTANKPAVSQPRLGHLPRSRQVPVLPSSRVKKYYTVKKGENLSDVALKVYGAVEGKRMVNVLKIQNANKVAIPNVNVVKPGMKLVIPAIVNINIASVTAVTPRVRTAYKAYTVQEGDSIWKIAQRKLGNGNRYKEIIKLNSNIGSGGSIKPGMKLKMPK